MNKEIIQQLVLEMQEVFEEGLKDIIEAEDYSEFNKQYAKKMNKSVIEWIM